MQTPENSVDTSSDDDVLRVARERFKFAEEAESDIRTLALEDLKFSAGDQWPSEIKSQRDLERKPCLTINRLPQFIRQITNDLRQNRPAIKVSPVDDKGDIETAEIFQGIIRHIEYSSDADIAYDTAVDSAVRASFGYFRVITDYADPMSFDQEIRFLRVPDRFSVYLDPNYQQPDGSDAEWGFVFENISKDEFKLKYPGQESCGIDNWETYYSTRPGWVTETTVRVAEYFFKSYRKTKIALLSNKEVVELDDLPEILPAGITIVSTREAVVPEIKWWKINGYEKLEETKWLGRWIPIIPVLGEEQFIDGKRVLEGVVRHAKDSQRMYNYWTSSETETIALAPRAPYLVTAKQIEGYEKIWEEANTRNHAYLPYNARADAPPPQRNVYEPPVQAITHARMLAGDDLKATTGIYDAALGAKSNENSGIAIQRRNIQAQTSNFHFVDNLSRSIRHCGRILVDLIPKVYDTDRAVRILGEDGTEEVVTVNAIFNRNGQNVRYDLSAGKYDVTVSSGPSFETKRQEAAASMADLIKSYPPIMQVAGDLMVRNLDWPGAKEIADRLKKTLPPGVGDDQKGNQQLPPQVQAMIQQLNQMNQALTEQLNHKTEQINTKSLELESKERIAMAQIQAELQITAAKLGSSEAMALLEHQVNEVSQRLELLHERMTFEQEMEAVAGTQPSSQSANINQPTGGQQSPGQPMGAQP